MSTKVSIGPTTKAAWGAALAGIVPLIIEIINGESLGQPQEVAAIGAVATFIASLGGRYAQSHALIKAGKEA